MSRIAAIVHDLDLKDGKFGAPECSAVAAMIEGLQLAYQQDDALLEHGMALFDAIHSVEPGRYGTDPPTTESAEYLVLATRRPI